MSDELLLLIKNYTDTLIEQTKTKPQETLEFKMNKQMQTFSFYLPIILHEEGKWLLGVSSFECTNSVFNITNENNSFSITKPGQWIPEYAQQTIDILKELMELDKRDLSLHIAAVRERGRKIYVGGDEYDLSDLDNNLLRNEIFEKLKNIYTEYPEVSADWGDSTGCEHVIIDKNAQRSHIDFNEGTQCVTISFTDHSSNKYRHPEDMVYRLQLTYDETVDILDFKYLPTSTKGYTLVPGIYEVTDINFMLKSLLLKKVKVIITLDEVRLKSNLSTNKTIRFTKKSFFYVILGFIQSHSGDLGDIPGFIQLIPGSDKSDRPINITGIDKVHIKCDCINGGIVNGVGEPILFSFALS